MILRTERDDKHKALMEAKRPEAFLQQLCILMVSTNFDQNNIFFWIFICFVFCFFWIFIFTVFYCYWVQKLQFSCEKPTLLNLKIGNVAEASLSCELWGS